MFINNSNDPHNLNSRGVLDNDYYNHACLAYKSLTYVTPHTYRPDDTSKLINTGERLYKGFLQSAVDHSDYELPNQNFLTVGHNIFYLYKEIKREFPTVFPWETEEEW